MVQIQCMNIEILVIGAMVTTVGFVYLYVFLSSAFRPNFGKLMYSIISSSGIITATLMIKLIGVNISWSVFIIGLFVIGSMLILFDHEDRLYQNSTVVFICEGLILVVLLFVLALSFPHATAPF